MGKIIISFHNTGLQLAIVCFRSAYYAATGSKINLCVFVLQVRQIFSSNDVYIALRRNAIFSMFEFHAAEIEYTRYARIYATWHPSRLNLIL